MLSTTHALFCRLQDDLCHSLTNLPNSAPAYLKTALVKAHWKLLNDENNYIKLHPLTAIGQLDIKCVYMEEIARLAKDHLPNGKQLDVFF